MSSLFLQIDTVGAGVLTASELQKAFKQFKGKPPSLERKLNRYAGKKLSPKCDAAHLVNEYAQDSGYLTFSDILMLCMNSP